MDNCSKSEAPVTKTWAQATGELIHNPYADVALAGVGVIALIASKGKLAGISEKLFPKAASLLEETVEKDSVGFSPSALGLIPGRDPSLSGAKLAELAESKLSAVQYNVVVHPNVLVETLSRLAKTGDSSIKETVASSLKTPSDTLDGLLNLSNPRDPINLRIVGNPGATGETLDKIFQANSSILDAGLQRQIARHANTSPETLSGVLNAELSPGMKGVSNLRFWDHEVVGAVATHPNTPTDTLKTIATSRESISGATLKAVVEHQNTTSEVISDVASRQRYVDRDTWLAIASSDKATPETLHGLVTGRAIQMDREGVTTALLRNPLTRADTIAAIK